MSKELLALLHVVFDEGLTRVGPLAAFTKGVDVIRNLVAEFPPEKVASITGIDSSQIRILAREFASAQMPGVVSIPHGWGHDRIGVQLEVAQQHAGQSINDLTDDLTIDALCGTAAFNGTWVAVDATK